MDYILGLDLGATSLGWSVVELGDDDVPLRLERMGVRIFSDGRDSKTKEPLAVARRTARGMRKRRDRYVMRRETLMNKLIKYGLMPESEAERKALERLNPYELRVKGLDEKLLPYELGRALFHINQRRGFKSNRKADRKNDEAGAMKEAIAGGADLKTRQYYNNLFHFRVVNLSGNQLIRLIYSSIMDLVSDQIRQTDGMYFYESHLKIFEAIKNRNPKEAAYYMAEHFQNKFPNYQYYMDVHAL